MLRSLLSFLRRSFIISAVAWGFVQLMLSFYCIHQGNAFAANLASLSAAGNFAEAMLVWSAARLELLARIRSTARMAFRHA